MMTRVPRFRWMVSAVFVALFLVTIERSVAADGPQDLSQQYPATLPDAMTGEAYNCVCDAKDVWRLTDFTFSVGENFRVETKAAAVVFGHHGTNVLWAVVFPDEPGRIVTATDGAGEEVDSIWIRLHPATVGTLFPAATVKGRGDESLVRRANRIAHHKLRSSYQSSGRPFAPPKGDGTIDIETVQGTRRFFAIHGAKSTVEYVDAFATRTVPVGKKIDQTTALNAFDKVWDAFDRTYAMFVIKPNVDWQKLRDEYRPRVTRVLDDLSLAELLSEMLAHLEDLHVSVKFRDEYIPGFNRDRPLNANFLAIPKLVGPLKHVQPHLLWSITEDGFGYVLINGLVSPGLSDEFDDVLQSMKYTRGMILDLRFNGGGSEPLAQGIAGAFLTESRVYAKSQYRSGPKHSDLSPPNDRGVAPRDPWQYVAPVVVLQGQRTMSSAESFVMMLAQAPHVKTLGDRTAGSSGNPRQVDAGSNIIVNVPTWIDLGVDEKPIDVVGILPQIAIKAEETDFNDQQDPILKAALDRLRAAEKFAGPAVVLRHGAKPPAERPRVLSVIPKHGSVNVDPTTEIRVRFDRPMDPEQYHLTFQAADNSPTKEVGFRRVGDARYDSDHHEFVFKVELTPHASFNVEIATDDEFHPIPFYNFFRTVDGVVTRGFTWQFHTSSESKAIPQTAIPIGTPQNADAETRRAKLSQLISQIRQKRRELKSIVVRVEDRSDWSSQPKWNTELRSEEWAQFWWQGPFQFRVEASRVLGFSSPFQIGGNETECWCHIENDFYVGPSEQITEKNISVADPFDSDWNATDRYLIAHRSLEYIGDEQFETVSCHRIRSLLTMEKAKNPEQGSTHIDWLIDSHTLLPVVMERFGDYVLRYEFKYEKLNEALPKEVFEPQKPAGMEAKQLEPFHEGCDHHFLNVRDGSSGSMSVRWGQVGPKATFSSGLN